MTAEAIEMRSGGQAVERKLEAAWRKARRFLAVRGIAYLLIWTAALLLVDLLIDWLFLLPGWARVLLVAANLAVLAWVLYRKWLRFLRRYDPVRVALQVERYHPELRSLLVSYVQFDEGSPEAAMASPVLVRLVRDQAVEATRPINFREIVDFRELRPVLLVSLGMVIFFGAVSVNWGDFVATLLVRMINPGVDTKYPTATQITSITGDVTVQQGKPVTIEAVTSGVYPAEGRRWLYVRPEEGDWERLAFPTPGERARFVYTLTNVYADFEYFVRLGDDQSQTYRVTVVPPPYLVGREVRLSYPAYTDLPDRTVESLNLEVPEGTRIAWRLTCDRPLAAAEVVVGAAEPLRLEPSEDGRKVRFERTAESSFPYHFNWTDREHGYLYQEDVHYFVQVVPDATPEVEITRPLQDEKATVAVTHPIAFRATDDYAVTEARIVYTVDDGPEQSRPIELQRRGPVAKEVEWTLRESIPDLQEGQVVTYAVEVRDNRDGDRGPNVARSQSLRLYIVSPEEFLRHVFEQGAKLFKEVEALYNEETEASGEVKTLKDLPTPAPPEPGTESPSGTGPETPGP